MTEEDQLKRMIMTFRVSELQMLLGFAGKNKTGRKNELQARALDIVKFKSPNIHQKIRELYKSIQQEVVTFGDRSQAAAAVNQSNIMSTTRVPSAVNSIAGVYNQTGVGSTYGSMSHNTPVYGSRSSSSQSHSSLSNSNFSNQNSHGSYPINPDVRLKKLPFFDILAELLKPCTLAPHGSGRYQEASFPFSLTPQQANKIAHSRDLRPGKQDYLIQVQVRFCLLETTCEQEDNFPPSITLKVNDKICPLPSPIPTNKAGVEAKRPSRPVNITGFCKISPTVSNRVLVTWASDYGRCYVVAGYLVQKLSSEDLLSRLKGKGPRLADFTKSLIKQKLRDDSECEIATTSLRCSLLCPLGKMRMVLPCRAETCNHLQCFDASLYLQMNERKPTWTCPVCDKPAMYDNLVIDGYFQDVLHANSTCSEITLNQDGSWSPLVPKREPKEHVAEKRPSEVAVETLSDDSDDDNKDDSVIEETANSKRKVAAIEIVTLSDSENEEPPLKKATLGGSHDTDTATKGHSSGKGDAPTESSEASKSNDSWHVGEVDHGKRLVFRKVPSSSMVSSAGYSCASPISSPAGSPQVICLDSPVPSPAVADTTTSGGSGGRSLSAASGGSLSAASGRSLSAASGMSALSADDDASAPLPPPYSSGSATSGYSYDDPASSPMPADSPPSAAAAGSDEPPFAAPVTDPFSGAFPPLVDGVVADNVLDLATTPALVEAPAGEFSSVVGGTSLPAPESDTGADQCSFRSPDHY